MSESVRGAFEAWITRGPFELSVERYPGDPAKYAWPGAYKDYNVEMAWSGWKEGCDTATKRIAELETALREAADTMPMVPKPGEVWSKEEMIGWVYLSPLQSETTRIIFPNGCSSLITDGGSFAKEWCLVYSPDPERMRRANG